jgi:predicted porin
MKKITLLTALLVSMVFAEGNSSKYSDEEIANMSPEEKMLYMPDIVTPDDQKSGIYAGLGLAASSLSANGSTSIFSSKKDNNKMLDLAILAGYNFNEYLSAETRAIISTAYDDSVDFRSWGLYLKPQYEMYKDLKVYSLIGYGSIDAKNINSKSLRAKSGTAQVGVGADYKLGNNFKLFADYIYLGSDDSAKYNNTKAKMKSSAITTGITYDF